MNRNDRRWVMAGRVWIRAVCIVVLAGMLLSGAVAAADSWSVTADGEPTTVTYNGSGTVEDPYLIDGNNSMMLVRLQGIESSNTDTKHFKLTADIDASSTSGWNANAGFTPISTVVSGSLDGDNFTISDLYIDQTSSEKFNSGLFAMAENFTIRHLTLADITVKNNKNTAEAGAIIGKTGGQPSTIEGVQVTGSVESEGSAGGLIGFINTNIASIHRSSFEGNVTGDNAAGGLVGTVVSGVNISDSYAILDVLSARD